MNDKLPLLGLLRTPLLRTENLAVGYASGRVKHAPVANTVNVDIHAGQLICLLGPNGSGKSTLLRTLAGLQPPLAGVIEIGGINAGKLKPAQLAKLISLVLTDSVRLSNLNVYSLVALGRYPHSNWLGTLEDADKAIIDQAIEETGIAPFLKRKIATLSDGECQKVMLARALAQDTPILMLDEPTAHLDLPSRIQLMRLLLRLTRHTDKGILISTHELDLALQVADEVWLLSGEGHLHKGTPEDLVLNGTFEAAFNKEGILFDKATGSFPMNQGNGKYIMLEGEGPSAFWTARALQRIGYTINPITLINPINLMINPINPIDPDNPPDPDNPINHDNADAPAPGIIRIREQDGHTNWILEREGRRQEHGTIEHLLQALKNITHAKGSSH
jgi:cobalamin transport system ATP-binding protein